MLYQNSPGIIPAVKENGCAFMCALYLGEAHFARHYNSDDVNSFWESAIANDIITGDLNGDGVVAGPKEGRIRSWDKLMAHLVLPLRIVLRTHAGKPTHLHNPAMGIPPGCFGICAWQFELVHFVVGTERPVEYDPWYGGSRTVRYGAPQADGLRIFQRIG